MAHVPCVLASVSCCAYFRWQEVGRELTRVEMSALYPCESVRLGSSVLVSVSCYAYFRAEVGELTLLPLCAPPTDLWCRWKEELCGSRAGTRP